MTFHPEHIFQLVLYRDVLPFKLLTRKLSIFSLQKRNLDQGSRLFLPWLLQIMGSHYLSCQRWSRPHQTRPAVTRARSQPLCSTLIWPSSFSKGNAFCREALFSESAWPVFSEAASAVMIAFLECVGNLLNTPGLVLQEPSSEAGRKISSQMERETTACLAKCTSLEGRITRPIPGICGPFILGLVSLALC